VAAVGAVLDACVLAPAALRDTLLRAAAKGLYRLVWSDLILAETERALIEAGLTDAPRARRLIEAMRLAFPDAAVVVPARTIEAMPNDPKDRHVAAAAVAARVQVIVTANLRDFPALVLDPLGVHAESPDVFLNRLCDHDLDLMAQIVAEQAAALRAPPMTVEEVLDNLADYAPTVVARLRRRRAERP
jgi:predicted nucleic acid-binding protein